MINILHSLFFSTFNFYDVDEYYNDALRFIKNRSTRLKTFVKKLFNISYNINIRICH